MKKLISVLLAAAALLSLCSCSGKSIKFGDDITQTTEAIPGLPSVETTQDKREFKDESGRTVCLVTGEIPQLSGGAGYPTDKINSALKLMFVHKSDEAKNNIKNAAEFMDSQSSEQPWSTKLTYELKYMDESIVSFLCNIYFSYFGPDTLVPSHTAVGVCVDMKTGEILNLLSFAGDEKDAARQQLIEIVQKKSVTGFYAGNTLTEEQLQLIADTFDESNFWYKDGVFSYFFDRATIAQNDSGYYVCELRPSDYSGILSLER